ncbi:glycosyltransferase family 2 protein [Cronobacter sp. JZ38]|uniref:glycosyltransferase family 2 protein n=1 Tax=Cronobacter sp. JZ38 TaxID=1906275 RepID=UPI002102B878|nr:glycosyltransferase family 2 protein [Cronobacter sp. JZ38]
MMSSQIYSIITTYNPEIKHLNILLEAISKQSTMLVICNNSEQKLDPDILNCTKNVKIINFGKNLGIAEAQSIGMKWAFENGADFILQMDQDSTPHDDMVAQLLRCYEELTEAGYKVGLVGAQDYDRFTGEVNKARVKKGKPLYKNYYYTVDSTLSSGSLIPKTAWEKVGGMRDDLFIDAVDHEYCWRLRSKGFLTIRNLHALLGHRLGDGRFKILSLISVGLPSPFRHYYATRNIFLLLKEKHVPLFWKISSLVKLSGKVIFYPIFLPKGKERMRYFLKGIKDGVHGKTGKMS